MKTIFLALLIITALSCQKSDAQHKHTGIGQFINQKMSEAGIVGLSAAIVNSDGTIWSRGFGFADQVKQSPFTPATIINAAGISKTVTGFCLMKAVEEKGISLDDDINRYLPFKVINPYFPEEIITLRQIATHTSSIFDQPAMYDSTYRYGSDPQETIGHFLKEYFSPLGKTFSEGNFLNKKPGTYFNYSNIATCLAAYMIEMITKENFNAYSKRVLFQPLEMRNTGWLLAEVNLENHSRLYRKEANSTTQYQLYGITTYPDGGLRTSVDELSKFLVCVLNDGTYKGTAILKKKSAAEFRRPHFSPANQPANMDLSKKNYGIFTPVWVRERRLGNSGGDKGVINKMFYDPQRKIGVILFANTSLDKEGTRQFDLIFEELWNYAATQARTQKQ